MPRHASLLASLLMGLLVPAALLGCGDDEQRGASMERSTATCTDGLDNDGDGFIDCLDQDCLAVAACTGGDTAEPDAVGTDATQDTSSDTSPTDVADTVEAHDTAPAPEDLAPEDLASEDTAESDTNDDGASEDVDVPDPCAACSAPMTCCERAGTWTCVDPLTDDDHCGACDTACASGEACEAGLCQGPDFVFEGTTLSAGSATVAIGEGVTWANATTELHSVDFVDAAYTDTGDIAPGASVTVRFEAAGSVNFRCGYHPARIQEAGYVVVTP